MLRQLGHAVSAEATFHGCSYVSLVTCKPVLRSGFHNMNLNAIEAKIEILGCLPRNDDGGEDAGESRGVWGNDPRQTEIRRRLAALWSGGLSGDLRRIPTAGLTVHLWGRTRTGHT
jgi:hypothetical protein